MKHAYNSFCKLLAWILFPILSGSIIVSVLFLFEEQYIILDVIILAAATFLLHQVIEIISHLKYLIRLIKDKQITHNHFFILIELIAFGLSGIFFYSLWLSFLPKQVSTVLEILALVFLSISIMLVITHLTFFLIHLIKTKRIASTFRLITNFFVRVWKAGKRDAIPCLYDAKHDVEPRLFEIYINQVSKKCRFFQNLEPFFFRRETNTTSINHMSLGTERKLCSATVCLGDGYEI